MGDGADKSIIAERLDRLFATMAAEGRPCSLREAADGINARAGGKVMTFQYLAQLRSGARRQPGFDKLRAIASWFGVSVVYFTDSEAPRRTAEERRFLDLMRDAGVRRVAFLAKGLSPESLKLVADLLEVLRKAEGLPPVDADGRDEEPAAPASGGKNCRRT